MANVGVIENVICSGNYDKLIRKIQRTKEEKKKNILRDQLFRFISEDPTAKYDYAIKTIHFTKDRKMKNLMRDALAKELLKDGHRLARGYNSIIKPIRDQRLEFSQLFANAKFKAEEDSEFKHQGQSVYEAAKPKNFDTKDFKIHVFQHPAKPDTLVADNNRGLAAHVLARQNVGRYIPIDMGDANQLKSFVKRSKVDIDGEKLQFDKNVMEGEEKMVELDKNTKITRQVSEDSSPGYDGLPEDLKKRWSIM
eukprot:GFUD01022727.1.p1 GENE.GFUD01022727.1~~GFUD01022727.1.p1  ORF type:complete len:252 (+),score=70.43 GFUD01022727.1:93-848(+)